MIGGLTKPEIDLMARDIRTRLLTVLADAERFDAMLTAAHASGALTAPETGYTDPSPDLSALLGMADQYAAFAATFGTFDTYGAAVPPLLPPVRGL